MKWLALNYGIEKESDFVTWWEIALMFFLLSFSGNPYISIQKFELFTVLSAIVPIVHMARNYKKAISFRTAFVFVFLLGYELMHAFMFNLDYSMTFFKLALILLFSAAIIDILKDRFVLILTKTMVLISLVSFVFVFISYTPIHNALYNLADVLFPIDKNYEGQSTPTVLIYTFCREYFVGELPYVRNAGIFWESGAFAVFLNINLFLHYSSKQIKVVNDLFDRDAIILIAALVTTTSTMGALSLMIVLVFFSAQLKSIFKYVLLFFILILGFLSFTTVDFLGDKINRQLNQSNFSNNRFGSALKDFENISERPLLGWSRRIEVIFNTNKNSKLTHRPNGFTNFLRSYGLVYFLVYFVLVYQSFKNIYVYHHHYLNYFVPLFGIILLWIVSFSELIFDLVFFKALIFLYWAYYPYETKIRESQIKKPYFY
ncbi:MAG TPA: hypothetical protein DGG95_11265 [Cytophagales bacterium]|jgi:hypothetical protein|nr:hypothetical protein [Cytophagales bacterium]